MAKITEKSPEDIAAELDELDEEPEDDDDENGDEPEAVDPSAPDAFARTERTWRNKMNRALTKMIARQEAARERAKTRWEARIQAKLDELALSSGGTAANPEAVRASLERQIERHAKLLEELQAKMAQLAATEPEAEAAEASA